MADGLGNQEDASLEVGADNQGHVLIKPSSIWKIHRGNVLVGTATLQWSDQGVRGGLFTAGPGYEQVRSVFRAFTAADDDERIVRNYYQERDALGLAISDELGGPIAGVVHILDFQADLPDEPLTIEIYPAS